MLDWKGQEKGEGRKPGCLGREGQDMDLNQKTKKH
jgi:hypothetical protein